MLDLNDKVIAEAIMKSDDTNEKYNIFHDHLSLIFDKHVPLRTLTKREVKNRKKPWITTGLLKSIKSKSQFYNF